MPVGLIHCKILIPDCRSLKEKRGRLKPLLYKIHKKFNVSVSEMDDLDLWNQTSISCAVITNKHVFSEKLLQNIVSFIEEDFQDLQIINYEIEIF